MKICYTCKIEKNLEEFAWINKSKNEKRNECKICSNLKKKEHYKNNSQYYKNKAKIRSARIFEENKKLLIKYLLEHPCIDCKECNPVVLQFDHVKDIKRDNISSMLQKRCSWSNMMKEIEKCEVRCANCHLKRTAASRNYWKTKYFT